MRYIMAILVALFFISNASAILLINQSNGTDGGTFGCVSTCNPDFVEAQSFTPNVSSFLGSIMIKSRGSQNNVNVTLTLATTNASGSPKSGTNLTTVNKLFSANDSEWIPFNFTTAVFLTAGTKYTFISYTPQTFATYISTANPYVNGSHYGLNIQTPGSDWVENTGVDLVFIMYSTTAAPSSITVNLVSPTNDTILSGSSNLTVQFNSTVTSTATNLSAARLFVWHSNGTLFNNSLVRNISGLTNATLNFNISNLPFGDYQWNVLVNGTNSTNSQSQAFAPVNYTFSFQQFSTASQSFTNNVYETDYQFFAINLTTTPDILSVSASLIYDGTPYIASTSCANSMCSLTRRIDIPLITSGAVNQNKTFFWNLTLFDGTDSSVEQTTTTQQNVTRIFLDACDNPLALTPTLNFTLYDETNRTRIIPMSFKGTFNFWLGTGSKSRNISFDNSSIAERTLCMTPGFKTMYSNAIIEYNSDLNTTDYITRNYYLQNSSLTNITNNVSLFVLAESLSTSFILKVQDKQLFPIPNALIFIQRYYPGLDRFDTVQIARTDSSGESIGFYKTEDVDYRHIIVQNGTVLLNVPQQKIVGKETPFTITFTIGEGVGSPWEIFENNSNIQTTISFDEETNILTYVYIDTSGLTTNGRLVVSQGYANQSAIVICTSSSNLASATLTCNLTGYSGTFIARGYVNDGNTLARIYSFVINEAREILDKTGLLMAWFIILTASMAFIWNPTVGIIAVNAAIIFVNLIGLASFGIIFTGSIIAISVLIVILIND